jgi:hypothetical protein
LEGLERELVRELCEERLEGGLATPEGVEAEGFGVEIDFAANEAVNPQRVDGEEMPKQPDATEVVGPSKEDDSASRRSLKILLPGVRERSSRGSGEDTFGSASAGGGDELGGLILERLKGVEVKSAPDLGLPTAVVAFDSGLEAGFARWREDGSDLQGEANAADTTDVIGVVMSALESSVVVELSVAGQAELTPMIEQSVHRDSGRDGRSGPGSCQATVKRDGVEDLDVDSAFNDKAFDDVEAIGLGVPGGHFRQIPAAGRGWSAHPRVAIQSSSTLQDSSNGANRRDPAVPLPAQLAMDRGVTVLSQVAGLPKLLSQPEDFLFESRGDAISGLTGRSSGPVGPIDAVQPLPIRPTDPAVHRRGAQPISSGNGSERTTSADGGDHFAPQPLERVFLKSSPLLSAAQQITAFAWSNRFATLSQGYGPMEADGVWKAAEYGAFPHPLENASRFPQLPQAQLLLNVLEKRTQMPRSCSGVADS